MELVMCGEAAGQQTPWFEVLEIKIRIKNKHLNYLFAKNNNDCTCYAYYIKEGLHCIIHEHKKILRSNSALLSTYR